jgi:hypothetical protein
MTWPDKYAFKMVTNDPRTGQKPLKQSKMVEKA